MKKLFTIALALVCASMLTPTAHAAIDWAGNVFPNDGFVTTPTGDLDVYAQVYKDGVTDPTGQGADLSGTLVVDNGSGPQNIAMTYLGDIGNNDEYVGVIPQAMIVGASSLVVTVIFDDATDGTQFEVTQDQTGTPPPFTYTVSDVLPVDVTVSFNVCMSGMATAGDVCVIGSATEIGAWGTGVNMTNTSGELWTVDVVFPAGSSPSFEYKYRKDGCVTWESTANRAVVLPTDGTTNVALDTDSWEFRPIGCGLGDVLSETKTICFQVCMAGIDNTGGVCVIGNLPELGNWTTGVPMTHLGGDIWEACIQIPAGTPAPLTMEYKFQKDDCATWEGIGNRMLLVDDALDPSTLLEASWDDAGGICDPVSDATETFGSVKARFNQ